jgi:Fe2+ transport system protein FeoA
MGLLPGAEIEVMSNSHRGPFIIAVKGTRVVLGRGVAQKVLVE